MKEIEPRSDLPLAGRSSAARGKARRDDLPRKSAADRQPRRRLARVFREVPVEEFGCVLRRGTREHHGKRHEVPQVLGHGVIRRIGHPGTVGA